MAHSPPILGFATADPPTKPVWHDTYLGGASTWPYQLSPKIPPCPLCHSPRQQLLQAYAPHPTRQNRAIYIFGCNSITCSSDTTSWFSVRLCGTSTDPAGPVRDAGADQGGTGDDLTQVDNEIDWDSPSESDASSTSEGGLTEELELLSLEVQLEAARSAAGEGKSGVKRPAKRERSRKEVGTEGIERQSLHRVFEASYVEVDHEPTTGKSHVREADVTHLLERYLAEEKERGKSGASEVFGVEDEDEETESKRQYEEFQERIARAPTQILRYHFGGTPLWPRAPAPVVKSEKCECGSAMVFEMQLLGSCLHYLQPERSVPEQQKEAGMNFASVAVFTCATDCTAVNVIAESCSFKVISQAVCVQQDEW